MSVSLGGKNSFHFGSTGRYSFFFIILISGTVFSARSETRYVALNGANQSPYTNWHDAATNIQNAVNAAVDGDTVLVSNGTYNTGSMYRDGNNRVVIDKAITVHSVNGPLLTVIAGEGPAGSAAVRCAYLGSNACLSGFTITNGYTATPGSYEYYEKGCGGGLYCTSESVISNCIISGNTAHYDAGGIYRGTVLHCTVSGNTSQYNGGGLKNCIVRNSIITDNSAGNSGGGICGKEISDSIINNNSSSYEGGGVSCCMVERCVICSNTASLRGGGIVSGTVGHSRIFGNSAELGGGMGGVPTGETSGYIHNCLIYSNTAIKGGGVNQTTVINCTVTDNTAEQGGGAYNGVMYNSIVYYNAATVSGSNYTDASFFYSCTAPLVNATGNLAAAPAFLNYEEGNMQLAPDSPCINKGNNDVVFDSNTDLDGYPRIICGIVDMGAYEFIHSASDYDGDGMGNGNEEIAGTDATDAKSCFTLSEEYRNETSSGASPILKWQSVTGRFYTVWTGTTLIQNAWTNVPTQTDVPGTGEIMFYTNTFPEAERYFRLSVYKL